ncbi:hypothetical protein EV07_1790 [Prochlorococcus sp. MIT 0603]|nr:hypothetical protein EV07_1790 [Prochlorococcus sp. MIT 0603]
MSSIKLLSPGRRTNAIDDGGGNWDKGLNFDAIQLDLLVELE